MPQISCRQTSHLSVPRGATFVVISFHFFNHTLPKAYGLVVWQYVENINAFKLNTLFLNAFIQV